MTAVSMTGMHALLKFMHTPDDIFKDAYAYVMIICGGIFAQALYNILASILRALGNSKVPLYFLILSAMLNIVLDLVFIISCLSWERLEQPGLPLFPREFQESYVWYISGSLCRSSV